MDLFEHQAAGADLGPRPGPRFVRQLRMGLAAAPHEKDVHAANAALGLPSKFEWKRPSLLRGGYVRELAAASGPHIHGGGGDFLIDCRWRVR